MEKNQVVCWISPERLNRTDTNDVREKGTGHFLSRPLDKNVRRERGHSGGTVGTLGV